MKKIIIVMVMVAVVLSLTACGQQADKKTNVQEATPDYVTNNIHVYVDPETGVNYLVYHGYNCGGMTVRYDSEGNVMVTK